MGRINESLEMSAQQVDQEISLPTMPSDMMFTKRNFTAATSYDAIDCYTQSNARE